LLSTVCGKHVLKLVDLCSFLISMVMMLTRGVLKRWWTSISGDAVEFFSISSSPQTPNSPMATDETLEQ
ncbi:hypothetical protein Droror1_Dr00008434, partial [Drosera rotundifolia]